MANDGRVQLLFPLLILIAFGGVLALAGPGGAQPEPVAPSAEQLDPAELERISVEAVPGVADGVERIRGLEFRRLPEPEVVSSAYLNRLGARELERQEGELGLAADDAVGRITGLLAPGEDLRAAYESTGDLAAAAYDPRTKRLFVVSDAVAANPALVEFVLAHELDHALEDQRFGLRDARRLDDDGALAAQALTEGSATAVMTDFAVRHLNPLELLAATDTIDQGAGDVPAVLVEQLTWTYLGGQRFVTELRELAGGWKLVDYALSERPPASTEQVLHPRKYLADERPEPVRIDPGELEARGWQRVDRNVFGELATDYLLRVGGDAGAASAAAAGWNGDRYELWRRATPPAGCEHPCRSHLALVARWSWDSAADRAQFDRAATGYVTAGLDGKPVAARTWSVEDGSMALASRGDVSALVFAPDPVAARAVAAAQLSSGN